MLRIPVGVGRIARIPLEVGKIDQNPLIHRHDWSEFLQGSGQDSSKFLLEQAGLVRIHVVAGEIQGRAGLVRILLGVDGIVLHTVYNTAGLVQYILVCRSMLTPALTQYNFNTPDGAIVF